MSKIGKKPITLPAGVSIAVDGRRVTVNGPQGRLEWSLPAGVSTVQQDGQLLVTRENDERRLRALHGLSRALLQNMVLGVTQGFQKDLEVRGVGYKAELDDKQSTLFLSVGFSHRVPYAIPSGVKIEVGKAFNVGPTPVTPIVVRGIDKAEVGRVAAEIRAVRKPEPYQGKGIRYTQEQVRIKVGKRNV